MQNPNYIITICSLIFLGGVFLHEVNVTNFYPKCSQNILVYAFLSTPPQDCEQLTDLVKEISDVLRTRLGIGREMALVTAHR